ncbi:OmpA family protein [Rhodoblastus sp.]|jgi:outer membrane protein OmpA-like peptidoglycan-associated protein|uniref:OmpA family protein n=1 Tax=Rhodoblastus sp. TaxID=1962975 RepID=UPI0025D4C1AC|nr:OmpA family protein [Rhodoblastus sp.]
MNIVRTSLFALASLVGCGLFPPSAIPPAFAEDAPQQVAKVPTPVPFDEAVDVAARAVLTSLPRPPQGKSVEVVIDPLVDGATGARSVATRRMGERIAALAAKEFAFVRIVPFNTETLARRPILLMGAIAALAGAGQVSAPPPPQTAAGSVSPPQSPVYALWFTAADLSTGKVLGRGVARALGGAVDPTPFAAYAEAPVWTADAAVQGYIQTCRKAKPGDALNSAYADQLSASAALAQAEDAYNARQFRRARQLYDEAADLPGGRQLRTLNGLYLVNMRLGDRGAADAAFSQLVDFGLDSDRLAVKFLFRVNAASFAYVREARAYPQWLDAIARKSSAKATCLEIVGHTSPTGPPALNERLSLRRAEFVRDQLARRDRGLSKLMIARGAGSSEPIVGTGRDDASDALDRRVELLVVKCGEPGASPNRQGMR